MSEKKHFTVKVVTIDLLPYEKYIPGKLYDRRTNFVDSRDIDMTNDFFTLTTSPKDLLEELCNAFTRERNQSFNNFVFTVLKDKVERIYAFDCYEIVLFGSKKRSEPHSLWYKDHEAMEVDIEIYPEDVIEIRAVRTLFEMCGMCERMHREVVLKPCRHFYMCESCYYKWKKQCRESGIPFKCPTCKRDIEDFDKIEEAVKEENIDVIVCTKMSITNLLTKLKRVFI